MDCNLKLTTQRKYILEIMQNSKEPLSIEEVIKKIEIKYEKKIAFSTVFRNLEMLVKNKYVIKDFDASGIAIYVINNEHNHHEHILKCLKCNKEIVIEECPYASVNSIIEKETGFRVSADDKVRLCGYCKDCKK